MTHSERGLSRFWRGEFLSLEKTDGKLTSAFSPSLISLFPENKVRMKLVVFFVVSCLALHCAEGKPLFLDDLGWFLVTGCDRRLHLVGFWTGSPPDLLGALLASPAAEK